MIDKYGQVITSETEAMNLLYHNPTLDIGQIVLENTNKYESALQELYSSLPKAKQYVEPTVSIEEFDKELQQNWYMPDEYKQLDIQTYLLGKTKNYEQKQRVEQEFAEFKTRNMIPMLKFLVYMVTELKHNNIMWGVGRGSSVSSYILYLIGVHKVDSLKYDLDYKEFLR